MAKRLIVGRFDHKGLHQLQKVLVPTALFTDSRTTNPIVHNTVTSVPQSYPPGACHAPDQFGSLVNHCTPDSFFIGEGRVTLLAIYSTDIIEFLDSTYFHLFIPC